jgi:hypothetical protein
VNCKYFIPNIIGCEEQNCGTRQQNIKIISESEEQD